MDLPARIVALHQALAAADIPHAFGGALALAWCTQSARGTIDIDVNLLVPIDECAVVLAALPSPVTCSDAARAQLLRDGQARLWWDHTPIDLFLNTTPFHEGVAARIRWESFAGQSLPFLSCFDIAVFKAFFNRTKDWADLEAMCAAGTLDASVTTVIGEYLGDDDERVAHLRSILTTIRPG